MVSRAAAHGVQTHHQGASCSQQSKLIRFPLNAMESSMKTHVFTPSNENSRSVIFVGTWGSLPRPAPQVHPGLHSRWGTGTHQLHPEAMRTSRQPANGHS